MRTKLIIGLLALALNALAQGPNNSGTYYKSANGKKGSALKTALYKIISEHTTISYDGLLDCYPETDCREDGKLWDMYSSATNYKFSDNSGGYKKEGDCYNREHSVPQSWFNKKSPMKSDLVHVVPTDGYVNNRRSNYPFGETDSPTYTSSGGFSKLGPCSVSGYSGTVFEPNDEYKGDFARIYFYMATCYENNISTWSSPVMAGNSYPAYTSWFVTMLLRWAAEDPVSQKEIDRNNAVYKLQKNRNPYVDYPGLEQLVWGNKQDVAFAYADDGSTDPVDPDPTDPDPIVPDPVDPTPTDGTYTFRRVTSSADIVAGGHYLIVYEDGQKALSAQKDDIRSAVDVTISDGTITTAVNESGKPTQLTLGNATTAGAYTFCDEAASTYLALTADKNKLHSVSDATDRSAEWTISVSSAETTISSGNYTSRTICYNTSSPRFACYSSTSTSLVAAGLYRRDESTGIASPALNTTADDKADVYSIAGTLLRSRVTTAEALDGLPSGLYIVKCGQGKNRVVRVTK